MKLRARLLGLCCVLAMSAGLADDIAPNDWLQRMTRAVQTTDYDGTVIRIQNGSSEALKVVHAVTDGVVREKVIVQEGNGMEIIRTGSEVHCILPDRKSVLVEDTSNTIMPSLSNVGSRLPLAS